MTVEWRKSSRSKGNSNCVEVRAEQAQDTPDTP